MNSFKFTIKIYIKVNKIDINEYLVINLILIFWFKETRIIPFIIPKVGMYQYNWSESGIFNFEGIEDGFDELKIRLDEYFYMEQLYEKALIEYYDRNAGVLMAIRSQNDFESALKHSSQTYTPFSLILKVNAAKKHDQWTEKYENFNFVKTWKVAKPKFCCIREWLLGLEKVGQIQNSVLDTCSYCKQIQKLIFVLINI